MGATISAFRGSKPSGHKETVPERGSTCHSPGASSASCVPAMKKRLPGRTSWGQLTRRVCSSGSTPVIGVIVGLVVFEGVRVTAHVEHTLHRSSPFPPARRKPDARKHHVEAARLGRESRQRAQRKAVVRNALGRARVKCGGVHNRKGGKTQEDGSAACFLLASPSSFFLSLPARPLR